MSDMVDLNELRSQILEEIKAGKPLFGKDGAFAPLQENIINAALEGEMDNLELKWGEQYPIVIKSWRDNWTELTQYFQYTQMIRKLIYTTNTVEGYHRQIRKFTKNKGVFPNDTALETL